ncbi:MAG: endonuclease/exonuclease/phosphatase family protein [Planctomycetota bacterium]
MPGLARSGRRRRGGKRRRSPKRRGPWRVLAAGLRLMERLLLVALAAWCVSWLVVGVGAGLPEDWLWRLDMVTPAIPLAAVPLVAIGVVRLVGGRWGRAGSCALGLAGVLGLLASAPRSAWTDDGDGAGGLTLFVVNSEPTARDPGPLTEMLRGVDADLVALVEVDPTLHRAVRAGQILPELYPHFVVRRGVPGATSWRVLLSKVPLEDALPFVRGESEPGRPLAVDVAADGRRVRLLVVHPLSPRTAERWSGGNRVLLDSADVGLDAGESWDAAVVAGDFNASPLHVRRRALARRWDLASSKPYLRVEGTWPAERRRELRVPIDGVMASSGVATSSWSTALVPGSDHAGVLVRLDFAGGD